MTLLSRLRQAGWLRLCPLAVSSIAAWMAGPVPLEAAANPGRALTHEDMWLMKRVGAPFPSPDGKWVVYLIVAPAYDPKEARADLWISPADGGLPPRQLTSAHGAPSGLSWSRDGSRLAFCARRDTDEAPQVYVLDLAQGGDAERVTHVPNGARFPLWSPDGTAILFLSDVPPANPVKTKATVRTYTGFPIRLWDHWLDDRRPHLFVQELRPETPARDLLAGTRLVSMPGYGIRETETADEADMAWAPDGKSIVFAAMTDRDTTAFAEATYRLFAVPAAGGEPSALTEDADTYVDPAFTPDGRSLLCRVSKGGDHRIYHHLRLASFAWPFRRSSRKLLTASLDLTVGAFAVSADSATTYFLADTEGYQRLFSVPTGGGSARACGVPVRGCLSNLAMGGTVLVADWDSATAPADIVRIDPATGALRPLTALNAAKLGQLDLQPAESFTFTSRKGRTIQSFLIRPPDFRPTGRYPLLVVMHGGPASMSRDGWSLRWNYALLAASGCVIVTTNYTGSTGFSEAFGQAIQNDPLRTPGDEINQAADEAVRRFPFIDGSRQAAAGASYGGHLANWLEATTTRYRCLVAHAGLVNLETQWGTSDFVYERELMNGGPVWEEGPIWKDQNPVRYAGNHVKGTGWVTPMLLSVGERDARVPMNNTIEAWTYLQRLQVPSRLLVFPDENHWISRGEDSRDWYGEVRAWLERWLR
jgi:dipeptidyl aminopeptidase/acylaminoacyl peptidase